MKLKRFLTYVVLQIVFLLIITILFLKIARNDVWSGNQLQVEYKKVRFSVTITQHELNVHLNRLKDLPLAIGFVNGFYRSPQIRLYQSLANHNLTYQLKDTTYLGVDIFIRSFPLDSISAQFYNELPDSLKNYLQAYCDGINYGYHMRKSHKKVPFVLYKYRAEDISWNPRLLIKLLLIQKMLFEQDGFLILDLYLNHPKLKPFQQVFRKFLKDLQTFVYPPFSFRAFAFGIADSSHNEFLVFEKNVLPSQYIPVHIISPSRSIRTVFKVGNPFPAYIQHQFVRPVIDMPFLPEFHIADIKRVSLKKLTFSILDANGKPFYHEQSTYMGNPVFSSGRYVLYLPFPSPERISSLWMERLQLIFPGKLPTFKLTNNTVRKTPCRFYVNGKPILIDNPFTYNFLKEKLLLTHSSSLSSFQFAVIDSIRRRMPPDVENDTLQAIINMMKNENDFSSDYTILPIIWNTFFKFLARNVRSSPFTGTPSDYYQLFTHFSIPTSMNEEYFQPFLDSLYQFHQNDFTQWQMGLLYNKTFTYYYSDRAIQNIFRQHPIQFQVTFGLTKRGMMFTGNKDIFWINTLYISNEELFYASPYNDQVNDSNFWNFNRIYAK
jgi:hypothetical protein